MSDSENEEEKKELDLSSNDVVTKYKLAAEIANKALALVISEAKPGVKVFDLCQKGDEFITKQVSTLYTKAKVKIDKGVAFPTSVSLNNVVGHYSALEGDTLELKEGDVVKIDLGAHIDGFAAVVAHTLVLQEGPVTGKTADVIAAANTAAEVALRLVRPGKKNMSVTEAFKKVAEAYDVKMVEGVLSHQMKQFVIDGNKVVITVAGPEAKVDEAEFEENEVYAVDVVVSSGEGKPRILDEKQTSVYKRALDKEYKLKLKASRATLSEINQRFPVMPFTIRELKDKQAKLGVKDCVTHELLTPYPVLHEKQGDIVAHFKFTVLLMPNGSDRITGHPVQELKPDKEVDDPEIKAWLALGTKSKKKGGGAKKKAKKAGEGSSKEAESKEGGKDEELPDAAE
ncbi:metallopeptidase M24 family protein [Klebsormidium nitens]|uniref:ERBB-3 BINDING PROTEIN 1 n=1 Tax=Klebsormidium nitens TaxID=105231 RepID=A0A1Y1IFN7_KLENI|nr:metallopeptidase M24 family protein [Klebsormidium nitens]|eukprot:GAQ86918.1 metallopeptidase M24 family protein [Klebsormidium nitens]